MRIITETNRSYSMNDIPDEVDDLRYGVLDYSDAKNVDYIFIPLLFLESFNKPSFDLQIGPYKIQMPSDWSIVIADKHSGEVETVPLKQINDRDFDAFVINPITGYMPEFHPIEITDVYPDVKWFFPKLKYGHILAIPLTTGENPVCAFFVKDVNKIPDSLDIAQMV